MTWRERVAEARERGTFSPQDKDEVWNWQCCLVGEQHAQHPEVVVYAVVDDSVPRPLDPVLYDIGNKAVNHVSGDYFDAADAALDAIEDRVLQLKRGEV